MTEIVVDASAIVGHLLAGPSEELRPYRFHAPTLVDYEVASALRRAASSGVAEPNTARELLGLFLATDIERHDARRLLGRAWEFRHDLSAYDATYVALAEALGIPLLTFDARLGATARRWCDVIEA